jgi:hypothetical protein
MRLAGWFDHCLALSNARIPAKRANQLLTELEPTTWNDASGIEGGRTNMDRGDPVETTLGDLIVALTEEAARHVPDPKAANILVAYMLSDLFRNTEDTSRLWH